MRQLLSPARTYLHPVASEQLQMTLDQLSARLADRKDEIVELLSNEQPTKSRLVEQSYSQCTWWEGCYYCKDETQQWHQVKCFL